MKPKKIPASMAAIRTRRSAVYCQPGKVVPTKALPKAIGSSMTADELVRRLQELGIIRVVVIDGCRTEELTEPYCFQYLAHNGLVEEETGVWKTALIWGQTGIEMIRELMEIMGPADDRKAIAKFVMDKIHDKRLKEMARLHEFKPMEPAPTSLPGPQNASEVLGDPVKFDKELFMKQLKSKIPK